MVLTTNIIMCQATCIGHQSDTGVVMDWCAVIPGDAQQQAVVWCIDGQLYSDAHIIATLLEFATYDM